MTRSTNMEHVEVLRDLSEVCRAAIKAGDWKVDGACDPDSLLRHADAAIAALSAPQPPAEAQPVAWMRRCAFDRVDVLTLDKSDRPRGWNMHAVTENKALPDDVPLYAHPSPSAPVGVEGLIEDWESDLAEDKRDGVSEVAIRVQEIHLDQLRALAQQPAAVDGAAVDRVAAALLEEATNEPWTVAGVEYEGPDRDYYRKLARKVLALAAQPGGSDNDR